MGGRVAVFRVEESAGPETRWELGGGTSLLSGAVIAVMAARAIAAPETKDLNLWAGAMFHLQAKYPTFDYYVAAIGHSLAPWSAFLPFALGRLLLAPPTMAGGIGGASTSAHYAIERESLGRVAIIVGSTVALVAHGYLAARVD